jgi:hypothetical protein
VLFLTPWRPRGPDRFHTLRKRVAIKAPLNFLACALISYTLNVHHGPRVVQLYRLKARLSGSSFKASVSHLRGFVPGGLHA